MPTVILDNRISLTVGVGQGPVKRKGVSCPSEGDVMGGPRPPEPVGMRRTIGRWRL